jgi:hypothetical protein
LKGRKAMPSITVTIDGTPAFIWEGDDERAISDALARWREISAAQQLDLEMFSANAVIN